MSYIERGLGQICFEAPSGGTASRTEAPRRARFLLGAIVTGVGLLFGSAGALAGVIPIPIDDGIMVFVPDGKPMSVTQLHFPQGATPYADNYIKNFPYGTGSEGRAETYYTPYYVSGSSCTGQAVQRPACAPNLPTYQGSSSACSGLMTQSRTAYHTRPWIQNWQPTMYNNRAGYVKIQQSCIGTGNPDGICAVLTFDQKLMVADPIGQRGYPTYYCGSQGNDTFSAFGNGPNSRQVFPGEIYPDGWGLVPTDSRLFQSGDALTTSAWQVLAPHGKKVSQGIPGADFSAGDGYWLAQPISVEGAVYDNSVFGGALGAQCWPGATVCDKSIPRASISKVDGVWKVAISGYMTDNEGVLNNTIDYINDLAALSGYNSLNPTVYAITQKLMSLDADSRNPTKVEFYGHSLGAADATVLYQLGYGNKAVGLATPLGLPYDALKSTNYGQYPSGQRPIAHYCGVSDPICNPLMDNAPLAWECTSGRLNQCRQAHGVSVTEINTGTGVLTLSNPHDRTKYENAVLGGTKF